MTSRFSNKANHVILPFKWSLKHSLSFVEYVPPDACTLESEVQATDACNAEEPVSDTQAAADLRRSERQGGQLDGGFQLKSQIKWVTTASLPSRSSVCMLLNFSNLTRPFNCWHALNVLTLHGPTCHCVWERERERERGPFNALVGRQYSSSRQYLIVRQYLTVRQYLILNNKTCKSVQRGPPAKESLLTLGP